MMMALSYSASAFFYTKIASETLFYPLVGVQIVTHKRRFSAVCSRRKKAHDFVQTEQKTLYKIKKTKTKSVE